MPLHVPETPRLNHTCLPASQRVERETLGWDAPQLWGAGAMAGPSSLKEDIHACSRCLGRPGPLGNPTSQALRAPASYRFENCFSQSDNKPLLVNVATPAVTILDRTTACTGTHRHTRRHTHSCTHMDTHSFMHTHAGTFICTHTHT